LELGLAHYHLKQYPDAMGALQQAARLTPSDSLVQYALGMTYVQLGRKQDGLQVHRTLQPLDQKVADDLLQAINQMK
jgi:Flp pilus assembly protein TadD